jgi:hypothetical protein
MKFSINEFFVHEVIGDAGDSSARGVADYEHLPFDDWAERVQELMLAGGPTNPDADEFFYEKGRRYWLSGYSPEKFVNMLSNVHSNIANVGNIDQSDITGYGSKSHRPDQPSDPSGFEPQNEHQDPTTVVTAGSSAWSDPEQPVKVKKFSSKGGNLHIDLKEMFAVNEADDEGEDMDLSWLDDPELGAQSKVPSRGQVVTPGEKASPGDDDTSYDVNDDPFARSDDDLEGFEDDPAFAEKKPKPKYGEEGWAQYSPEFDPGKGVSLQEPKDSGKFWRGIESDDGEAWSWDELAANEPELADEIEREFPDLASPEYSRGAIFHKDSAGDLTLRVGTGARFKWDAANQDWIPMDDGSSPAGEF